MNTKNATGMQKAQLESLYNSLVTLGFNALLTKDGNRDDYLCIAWTRVSGDSYLFLGLKKENN